MSKPHIEYHDLNTCSAWKELKRAAGEGSGAILSEPEELASCSIPLGGGLVYNYAPKGLSGRVQSALGDLAAEQQVVQKYMELLQGERMNTGENRMVLHHLTRGAIMGGVEEAGRDLAGFYDEQRQRFSRFAERIHQGAITGSTGKSFSTVVQIGIGGSDLGPRALALALEGWAEKRGGRKMAARFISNVDPDDAAAVLKGLDWERTLFILVSKSGTTQETLTNRDLVLRRLQEEAPAGLDPARHMVAVTSESSPLAASEDFLESFYIDDYIGGRYSSTSAVGGVVLSLAYGPEVFEALLKGAHDADVRALEAEPKANAALMDALTGIWERNFLGCSATAVLPYSQALSRFPAHLQQLDMESNGKRVNRQGDRVDYATGPVIFGEPGTNGQHSFYQLLHQGTDTIPLQFIGFRRSQREADYPVDGVTSQAKLNANLAAQIAAFFRGKSDADQNRAFPGGRPSSLIYGEALDPEALGALLAHYENKVMFQGFLWNINSFDQEGVQLGKVLTKKVLAGSGDDPFLRGLAELLGVRA